MQKIPMTFEELMQSFQETRQELKERAEQADRERKKDHDEWNKRFGEFSDRLGEFIEGMVEGKIVRKFQKFGYQFTQCGRRVEFENKNSEISGELDLLLENGEYVLGIEVKLKLTISDVKDHIARVQKYRQYLDAKDDRRKILAAVAGGVIPKNVREFAAKNGLFTITQSGEAVEIIPLPKGFKPKEW